MKNDVVLNINVLKKKMLELHANYNNLAALSFFNRLAKFICRNLQTNVHSFPKWKSCSAENEISDWQK